MKAEELMKGDWITSEDLLNRPARYEGLYKNYTPLNGEPYRRLGCLWPGDIAGADVPEDRVLPIHITPEILEKNAEQRTISGLYVIAKGVMIRPVEGAYRVIINLIELPLGIFYVHQLQHVLRLWSIDKEITL